MSQKEIFASLELIDQKIRFILGEFHNNQLNILNVSFQDTAAIDEANIIDSQQLILDVKQLIENVNLKMERVIDEVLLLIPSSIMKQYFKRIKIALDNNYINQEMINNTIDEIAKDSFLADEILVNTNINRYLIDGVNSKKINFDKPMNSLFVDVDFYVGNQALIYDYLHVVEKAGLSVLDICFENLAMTSEMALLEVSHLKNIVIIRYEANELTLSFVSNGRIVSSDSLDFGFAKIIEEILVEHNLNYTSAKKLVLANEYLNSDNKAKMPVFLYYDGSETVAIDDRYLYDIASSIIKKQFSEIAMMIDPIMMAKETDIYLTGEGASIVGLDGYCSKILKNKVKTYIPAILGGRNSSLIANLGAIYAYQDEKKLSNDIKKTEEEIVEINPEIYSREETEDSMTNRFKELFKMSKHD